MFDRAAFPEDHDELVGRRGAVDGAPVFGAVEDLVEIFVAGPAHGEQLMMSFAAEGVVGDVMQVVGEGPLATAHGAHRGYVEVVEVVGEPALAAALPSKRDHVPPVAQPVRGAARVAAGSRTELFHG